MQECLSDQEAIFEAIDRQGVSDNETINRQNAIQYLR